MSRLDWEKLYDTYYLRIYAYALTSLRNETDAEEIAQQTFYRAMKTKSGFRAGGSEFSWLCSIAKNLMTDLYRRRKKEVLKPEETEAGSDPDLSGQSKEILTENLSVDSGPETHAVEQEDAFRIHIALHALKEPYREVFELRVFGELSYRQISEIFGRTENWARVTYYRARVLLRERMDADDEKR
jgi:RNA polymerase sigma factor (sigma-70 family)